MQIQANNRGLEKNKDRFAFWFVFSLILNGYATGIPGLSIGSAVYMIIAIVAVFIVVRSGKLIAETNILVFGLALSISSFLGMIVLSLNNSSFDLPLTDQIMGAAKFWLWVIMGAIVVIQFYDSDCFTKWMVRFSIVLTIYLLLQCVAFYGARVYMPNIFSFGPLQPYADGYADYESLKAGAILRPGSLLSESSFYGNFVMCTTALYLERFKNDLSGRRQLFIAFLSFGIILSGSTSAIILQGLILLLYLRVMKTSLKLQLVLIIALSGIVFIVLWFSGLEHSSVGNSLQYAFAKFSYLDQSTRFGKSYAYLSLIPKKVLLIGAGLGNDFSLVRCITGQTSIYFNSVSSLIVQAGIVGFGLFLVFILRVSKEAKKSCCTAATALLIVYFIKGIASGIYFSTYGILYMVVILGQIITERNRECGKIK